MGDMEFLQAYLVPILFVFYALMLLAKPPKLGASRGFCTQRAQKSEKAWQFAQRAAGLYCGAAGIVLFLVIGLIPLPFWAQTVLELALIIGLYPVVNTLLKKRFPDD